MMRNIFFRINNTITIRAVKDAKRSARNILIDNNKGKKNISDINNLSKLFVLDKNCSIIIFILSICLYKPYYI